MTNLNWPDKMKVAIGDAKAAVVDDSQKAYQVLLLLLN